MNPEGVCIAWCHPGAVDGYFAYSLVDLLMDDSRRKPEFYKGNMKKGGPRITQGQGSVIHMETGPRIGSARNSMVRTFLERTSCQWLWMLDADVKFTPDILDKLFDAADPVHKPIVSGLYFGGGRGSDIKPHIYKIVDPKLNGGNAIFSVHEYPKDSVIEVDGFGAGCLLMHRDALVKMAEVFPEPAPWFMETQFKGMEFGEDWTFCMRAQKIGLPLWLHTGAKLGHVKRFIIDEGIHEEWLKANEDKIRVLDLDPVGV